MKWLYRMQTTVPGNHGILIKNLTLWIKLYGHDCLGRLGLLQQIVFFGQKTLWKRGFVCKNATLQPRMGYSMENFTFLTISRQAPNDTIRHRLHWWQTWNSAGTSGWDFGIWGGEIWEGLITARANWIPNWLCRDHHPDAFSIWMAGGGVKPERLNLWLETDRIGITMWRTRSCQHVPWFSG